MRNRYPLVASLILLLVHVLVSAAAEPTKPATDVPGSATMPLTPLHRVDPARPAKAGTGVSLGVWVKADGSVEKADVMRGSKSWAPEVVKAALQWRFEPVVWNDTPLPARAILSFTFDGRNILTSVDPLPNLPNEAHEEGEFGLVAPQILRDPDTILPLSVYADGRRIEAGLRFVAEPDGTTGRIQILGASSEGALRTALDMVSQRTYQPGTIGGAPVAVQYQQVFGFRSGEGINMALDGAVDIVDPVYPYERLLAGEEGHAKVRVILNSEGGVIGTELLEASHPDFGGALVAAAESWLFSASAAAGQREREYRHEFVLAKAPYAARRLVEDAKEGRFPSKSAAGLDARPQLVYRPTLAYPTSLTAEGPVGSAKVQFVIDRVGLAQVPRVVEASRPEFSWAAATLVNGMRFQPVTRAGKPAEITVVMPVTFEPPKPAATSTQ